jgi:hypothetical protein
MLPLRWGCRHPTNPGGGSSAPCGKRSCRPGQGRAIQLTLLGFRANGPARTASTASDLAGRRAGYGHQCKAYAATARDWLADLPVGRCRSYALTTQQKQRLTGRHAQGKPGEANARHPRPLSVPSIDAGGQQHQRGCGGYPSPAPLRGGRNAARRHRARRRTPHAVPSSGTKDLGPKEQRLVSDDGPLRASRNLGPRRNDRRKPRGLPWATRNGVTWDQPGAFRAPRREALPCGRGPLTRR